jgi:drug/metabolite transporter (DMT)-like permease
VTALLALSASLAWGVSDFLGGTATRRLPVYVVIAASQALALAVLLPVAVLLGGFRHDTGYLPWALAAGAAGMVALGAFYRALAIGTMGVVAPIAATSVAVPVVVGLAQGDAPSTPQVAGIVAAGVGVVLASGPERRAASSFLPVGLALVAAAGFGLVVVLIAEAAESSTVMALLTMRVETVAVIAGGFLLARRLPAARRSDVPVLAATGLGDAGANAAFAVASTRGDLSIVSVLASLYPAVVVVLAREVHGERLRRVQHAGVALALAGVVLIAAGGGAA